MTVLSCKKQKVLLQKVKARGACFMIAVECCIKTDGFAAMDADELFFINGGSGNSGSGS